MFQSPNYLFTTPQYYFVLSNFLLQIWFLSRLYFSTKVCVKTSFAKREESTIQNRTFLFGISTLLNCPNVTSNWFKIYGNFLLKTESLPDTLDCKLWNSFYESPVFRLHRAVSYRKKERKLLRWHILLCNQAPAPEKSFNKLKSESFGGQKSRLEIYLSESSL